MTWLGNEAHAVRMLRDAMGDPDDETVDALTEGETSFKEAVLRALRLCDEDDMLADGIELREADLAERRKRLRARSESRRGAIMAALEIANPGKPLQLPDATVSIGKSPETVFIVNAGELPAPFVRKKVTEEPDKKLIYSAIKAGKSVPGAVLSNGAPRLIVRKK